MKKQLVLAALALAVAGPTLVPDTAFARDGYYRDRGDNVYRGRDRRYRGRCGSGNGAVGTVAGGAGGALIGNAVGGGTLGTLAGGVGGALLGRTLDKKNTRDKNARKYGC